MDCRAYLRRKCKVAGGGILIADDHPDFIDDVVLSDALQEWAGEAASDDQWRVTLQELGDLAHAMADDVMQQ